MSSLLTFTQVQATLGVSSEFIALLESEAIIVRSGACFTVTQVDRIRVAWNLHHELGVNLAGLEVALCLLDRLERERRDHAQVLRLLAARTEPR